MNSSIVIEASSAAAEAAARLLPSALALEASRVGVAPTGLGAAVVASFVGETSADLAIVFTEPVDTADVAGADSALLSMVDVLRPALEAAATLLGTGVLGEASVEDASALFGDSATQVFALTSSAGSAGWFAIRIRESGLIAGGSAISDESMAGNLGRISNVEMALAVEIGRTRMSVRDLLGLEPGAVIELDRSAGAPADVLLNGRLIAHGEIVVLDQDYAVRITKILDVAEGAN